MKMLAVNFSDAQLLKIKDVSEITGLNNSKVARAALRLGLMQVTTLAAKDIDKAVDLIIINDARSK